LGNTFLDGCVSFFSFDNDLVVFGVHSDAGFFGAIIARGWGHERSQNK